MRCILTDPDGRVRGGFDYLPKKVVERLRALGWLVLPA